ncbi:hypothetical protein [Aeromonas caviae]|uniref:hypothetical protein n=1 Tax=Aeromonas caviae TaxID=648 RepID=UPI0010719FCA|nr:hypothetical protein [Aeromonas caviae]WGY77244.1 hypothetical protein MLL77_09485 [Aeromonas caviae]
MLEIPTSIATGSLRVGLQVVSSHKKPVLEVYYQVRNRFGPEQELEIPIGVDGMRRTVHKNRPQDIFIQFTLVNIGGVRAENVTLRINGELKRHHPREDFGGVFRSTISQFAPGQSQHLFSFRKFDLYEYPEGDGSPLGLKAESLTITMEYDAPPGMLNWFLSLPRKVCGKKRFAKVFSFSPEIVAGDLPPAEYV